MEDRILVTRSSMPEMQEYIDEISDLWESHWLTNMGCKHKKLQIKLEKYLQSLRCSKKPEGPPIPHLLEKEIERNPCY